MKEILVDGSFVGKRVTGVQRFCWETLKELTKIEDLKVYLALPKEIDFKKVSHLNVEVISCGKKNHKFWQLFTLGRLAKRRKLPLLCMANFSPLFQKDYLVLHDVTYLDKQGRNRKLWALAYRILVGFRIARHKKIFTVSEFSRGRILTHYRKLKNDQVQVVGNGSTDWRGVEEKRPELLEEGPYFLSVGSTTKNKNFDYLLTLAQKYPHERFLVVGRIDGEYSERTKEISNLHFTGYLSDGELLYLYRHAKGLILPSFYEGFGLPPLEALGLGVRTLVLSDIPVFLEIYGKVANFFDPYDLGHPVDLTSLKEAKEEDVLALLEKYSWKRVAGAIFQAIETI